ncbi:MAG: hypothetical protein ABIO81_14280 [Ginsengibacter sp.]
MNKTLKNFSLQLALSFFLSASFLTVFAQEPKTLNKIYLQMGAGGGTFNSIDGGFAATAIIKNKSSITLSYHHLEMKPKNQPSDYQAETGYVFFIPYTNQITSNMDFVSLTAGKFYRLSKKIWATTEGGLSYTRGEKVEYKKAQSVSSTIIIAETTTSNYTTTKENKSVLGVMLQSDINWAFCSFIGVGAGVYANLNSVQSPIAFQIKLLIGKMGRENK